MPVRKLMQDLAEQIVECEKESLAHQEQAVCESDVFESARASSCFDGQVEALTMVLEHLELFLVDGEAPLSLPRQSDALV